LQSAIAKVHYIIAKAYHSEVQDVKEWGGMGRGREEWEGEDG